MTDFTMKMGRALAAAKEGRFGAAKDMLYALDAQADDWLSQRQMQHAWQRFFALEDRATGRAA